jgi:4-oxalocrotonate tautomerase family enzyme
MPRITIEWFNTRTDEQRREVARRITEIMVDVGGARLEAVTIRFDEYEPRLAARAGVMLSDAVSK